MRRLSQIASLIAFALVSCSYAESCQMERLNARVYDSKQSWYDVCREQKSGWCEQAEDEKGRFHYIKTFRTALLTLPVSAKRLKKI
jgi:hypothetical protein